MLTNSGLSICPNELALPTPSDLAIQMGRITRYGGAIWCPLLFHSLLVARMVADNSTPATTTWALFHDAHEIVMGEIPHPWKCCDIRRHYEAGMDEVFREAIGLAYTGVDDLKIKHADKVAVIVERLVLGPLANWEEYHSRFEPDFDPGDLETAIFFGRRLKWGGYAEASHCTRLDSGPIIRATALFELAYKGDYEGVVSQLKEYTE
jgi:hypothetical protein